MLLRYLDIKRANLKKRRRINVDIFVAIMPEYSVVYTSRTEHEERTKIINVVWNIPNFTQILENQSSRDIRTNKTDCSDDADEETKFQLKIQFVGREHDLLEIYYQTPVPSFLKSILTICLKCYKERSIVLKEYQMVQPNKWQFLGVLYKKDILSLDGNETFLNEGCLRLKFQFMLNREITVGSNNVPKPQLNDDLENMFKNSTYADVTIKSAEGIEFQVHKAILASRSAVLKAHFEHNTVESRTNIIESPLETEVLKEVLTYIYTDNAPKILIMPSQLLAAADFYQMDRLKHLCEESLHQSLTVDNAIDIFELADLHSAMNLKRKTLEFIKDGHAILIIKTPSWAKLQSVALVKTILEYIINDGQQETEDLR